MKNSNPGRFSKISLSGKQSRAKKPEQEMWMGEIDDTADRKAVDSNRERIDPPYYSIQEREFESSSTYRQPSDMLSDEPPASEFGVSQEMDLQKSSVDIIQTVLTRMSQSPMEVNPYYSKQTVGKGVSLLKSHAKLNSFAADLDDQASSSTPEIKATYGVLSLLLRKLEENWNDMQLQINEDQSDFELVFSDGALQDKDLQITELKKELVRKEQQAKEIETSYMQTIGNLSDAINSLSR